MCFLTARRSHARSLACRYEPQRLEGECLQLGNVKIVTVPPGRVGFVRFQNQIYLLNPGQRYVINSPYCEYVRSELLTQEQISVDSVSLVSVQAGQLAIVRDSLGHVVVIHEVGRFLLRQPEAFIGIYSQNQVRIDVEGRYSRLRLNSGELVFYSDARGLTHFCDTPCVLELRAPSCFLGPVYNQNEKQLRQGSLTIVRVQQGEIGVAQSAMGSIEIYSTPDRYLLHAPARFIGFYSVLEEAIDVDGRWSRRRLAAGRIQFYRDDVGEVHFYDEPGVYELRPPAAFLGLSYDQNDKEIRVGSVTVLRLNAGEFACVANPQGDVDVHETPMRLIIRAPSKLLGVHSVNCPRVEYGTYERVRLMSGQVIFYQDDEGRTRYYDSPNTYALRRPSYFSDEIYDVNTSVLSFGSIVRVNLKHGEISFKYRADGSTELLATPGVHLIERPEQFGGRIHLKSEKNVALGAFTMLNVPAGHVAIVFDGRASEGVASAGAASAASASLAGSLSIGSKAGEAAGAGASASAMGAGVSVKFLREGFHILDHELLRLSSIRSIQERQLRLECTVYARDRVTFLVKAFLLYSIVDPRRAFVDVEDVEDALRREAEATLLSVFGSHDADEVYKGVQDPTAHTHNAEAQVSAATPSLHASAVDGAPPPPTYDQSFAELVRSAFQKNIKSFAIERGVALNRMRIEHLDFADERMRNAIERQAEQSIQIAADRRNIEQRSQTALLEAQNRADTLSIDANARAAAKTAETMAEVQRIKETAEAQNVASRTPLAMQLALIDAYAKGQAQIFAALSDKISVVPSDIQLSVGSLPQQVQSVLAGAMAASQQFSVPERQ